MISFDAWNSLEDNGEVQENEYSLENLENELEYETKDGISDVQRRFIEMIEDSNNIEELRELRNRLLENEEEEPQEKVLTLRR